MKSKLGVLVIAAVCVAVLLGLMIISAPKFPVALLRVVDESGKGVAGAVIQPEGMRTKQGPYHSGWYSWSTDQGQPKNAPVTTDKNGYASVPYPKYVFERIETGTLCLAVTHPDFVPDRPERVVTTALPAGAPWREFADDLWNRIRRKAIMAHAEPIVLKKGAVLILSVRPGSGFPDKTPLYAQVSTQEDTKGTNFWTQPEPGMLMTRRLAAGTPAVRAVRFDAQGTAWFSDTINITTVAGKTNKVSVDLKPSVMVRGELDATVPRPIKHGRVIAHVWPQGQSSSNWPPQWHAWSSVHEDGSFEISSLPAGDLEILALCDGYVSTNGPGLFHMRYPQKHVLGTNDISIMIGMEPTAWLKVVVTDDNGKPLKDAIVSTWPNVRYGEWTATVLGSDGYNSSDLFLAESPKAPADLSRPNPDFLGTSDVNGLAVLSNLPPEAIDFTVEHARFVLPVVANNSDEKNREATVTLQAGTTNYVSVQLEPRGESPITHY